MTYTRIPNLNERKNKIEYGMTKRKLIELMGEPGMRNFNGNREVLQWCNTGSGNGFFVVAWLDDGYVIAVDSYKDYLDGDCSEFFSRINWW
jgi:hypothetical protein